METQGGRPPHLRLPIPAAPLGSAATGVDR